MKELFEDIEIFQTLDGSLGLFNKKLGEIYHSKDGAKKESYEKFIEPAKLIANKPLKILDICYGVGYNTKCAIENFKNIELIDCVEIDERLVKKSFEFDYCVDINKIIEKNLKTPDFIYFHIEDVRKFILKTDKKYDLIFHDGFCPSKQSELWSEELISNIISHLDPNGLYCTYNHSKPVLCALYKTGITLGKTIKNEKIIGTIAGFDKNLILNPYNETELGMLKTKSAITYKDKNLNSTHQKIVSERNKEVENSDLITLSKYKKLIQSSCTGNNFG